MLLSIIIVLALVTRLGLRVVLSGCEAKIHIDDTTDRVHRVINMTDQATFLSIVASADEYVHQFT